MAADVATLRPVLVVDHASADRPVPAPAPAGESGIDATASAALDPVRRCRREADATP